jgi:hypothetical protein
MSVKSESPSISQSCNTWPSIATAAAVVVPEDVVVSVPVVVVPAVMEEEIGAVSP